ncbi:MAG: DUF4258 domain-containing protein [Planctomycetes bacterium]|nr:DUF4258 domain-containing protein [Planctomycetota bacterium]
MPAIFDMIQDAVRADRYLIGIHAANQLDDRGIPDWQVVAGLADAVLIRERPHDSPNPAVEVEELLPDGTSVKAIWAWLGYNKVAKLVTVHYFGR